MARVLRTSGPLSPGLHCPSSRSPQAAGWLWHCAIRWRAHVTSSVQCVAVIVLFCYKLLSISLPKLQAKLHHSAGTQEAASGSLSSGWWTDMHILPVCLRMQIAALLSHPQSSLPLSSPSRGCLCDARGTLVSQPIKLQGPWPFTPDSHLALEHTHTKYPRKHGLPASAQWGTLPFSAHMSPLRGERNLCGCFCVGGEVEQIILITQAFFFPHWRNFPMHMK